MCVAARPPMSRVSAQLAGVLGWRTVKAIADAARLVTVFLSVLR